MKSKKIDVTFVVKTEDEFHLYKQLNEFLRVSFREFAATYNIQDYLVLKQKKPIIKDDLTLYKETAML